MRNIIFVVLALTFTMQDHANGLRCFAGIQPDKQINSFTSEQNPQDFKVAEKTITQFEKNI